MKKAGTHIVAGEIKSIRSLKTKKGQDMAFINLEYGDQTIEFAVFEQHILGFSDIIQECTPVIANIKVNNRGASLVNLEELF